jgi:SAM-dependent methyltransferase
MDIKKCITDAEASKSKLTEEYISKLDGLSSPKVWHLLNNLCSGASGYLEIGCFKGSTLLSALYNNPVYAFAIDNFSMSPKTMDEFFKNTDGADFEFYKGDCFTFNVKNIKKPIDLYFYDGDHSAEAQYNAITHFADALADEFIYVCDDWDLGKMKKCTFAAIKDLGYKIIECHELKGHKAGTLEEKKDGFWEGLGIVRVKK